jgi:heat shock protein HslJ
VNPVRLALLLLAAVPGCSPQPPAHQPPSTAVSITDRDWVLAGLGEHPAPAGAGGRPATLRLEAATARAVGFGGCNRFSTGYRRAGDSLTFGPVVSTKMSCADGDELERSFLGMLPAVATFQATDSALTLSGPGGILARFR